MPDSILWPAFVKISTGKETEYVKLHSPCIRKCLFMTHLSGIEMRPLSPKQLRSNIHANQES